MKILIVDDSRAMRMIVNRTLRQAGFDEHQVAEASNGMEALEVIRASRPDVVLADWNMPGMSGLELLGEIRRANIEVAFGFVTSEATEDMREKAVEAGAQFFVTKPFTAEAIREALGAFVS
jgi:two-component system chemotaxis response regulator CheY